MTPGDCVRRIRRLGYRFLGRGAYHGIREKLDPRWEYSQLVFTRLVRSFLRPGIRWLDAGCGHKLFETDADREELNMVQNVSLTVGCDLGLPALKRHRSIKNRVCCNLSMLPFRDASFDLITLNNVIEHLDKPEVVFSGLARTMNSGGRMVIHTPNSRSYFIRLVRFARLFLPQTFVVAAVRILERRAPEDIFPTHYRANTRAQLSMLLRKVGLEEERVSFARGGHLSAAAAPLVILEMLMIHLLDWLGSSELSSAVILGVYRRLPRTDQSWSQDYSSCCNVAAPGCEEKVAAEVARPGFKARA
jgi:2-polyprenyl-3-methyl-5-hydroxy-6-metoxy-1,4-benzoquinol methylase